MDDALARRVTHEIDVDLSGIDAQTGLALPGVFASGKQVVAAQGGEQPPHGKFVRLVFDDGSDMTFIGDFQVKVNAGS